jgi:hypothetical protein
MALALALALALGNLIWYQNQNLYVVRNQATVGVYVKGGVSTQCSAIYIRTGGERDKCEERGRTMSRSTNHHGLLLDKYKSIYTNDEAFGLAGQIAPLAHSNINRATPGLAGP